VGITAVLVFSAVISHPIDAFWPPLSDSLVTVSLSCVNAGRRVNAIGGAVNLLWTATVPRLVQFILITLCHYKNVLLSITTNIFTFDVSVSIRDLHHQKRKVSDRDRNVKGKNVGCDS